MAARLQLHALRNHPNLQRFLITNARPMGRELGAGSYGSVEELEVSGVVCAGKKIHDALIEKGSIGTENIASKYVEECQLMSDLRHPHLVQFLGVCFLPNSSLPVLVMERLLTSLDELLEHNPDIPLSLKRSILADVARGLVYLHSRSPPVIHRDLSARNVLLNSAMVAKITDLGNARIVNFQPGQLARTMSRIPGTMVYMPPEAFEDTSKYGPSLDSFSFGHLSLFAITQVFPGSLLQYTYPDPENPSRRLARTEVQRRDKYIKLLHHQLGEQHPLVLLVKQCLDDEPSERPTAQKLLQRLENIKRTQIVDPYQHLTKLKAMKMLKEKDTQVEALSTSRQELVALQTKMEQLQLEHSSQITAKDSQLTTKDDKIFRLGEEMKTLKLEHSSQITAKDSQLTTKDDEIFRLGEEMRTLKADLESRETRILELVDETERREEVIHRLMAELRGLQPQLQKAPVTPDLPFKPDERLTGNASASTTSAAATSATHTGPGGDSQQQEKPPENSESAFSAVIPSPTADEKNVTAVDQSEGLQNILPVLEARKAQIKELGAETERKEAEIHTELPPVRQDHPFQPDERLTGNASSSTTSAAATSATHTGPGDDSPVEELHVNLPRSVSGEAFPIPSPGTKEAEKKTTAVDQPRQAEGQEEGWTPGTEVVGIYDFTGSSAHDRPFNRGDSLTIISSSKDPNWFKARSHDGLEGMIPYNYVKEKLTGDASSSTPSATASSATDGPRLAVKLQSMPWFHGDIGRERAEQLLKPFKNGNFLLRENENYKGDYTLCVSHGTKVEHYRVWRKHNLVTVDEDEYFENLVKLVEHYQEDADGLCCRLMHPVKTSDYTEYTVSIQDFKERGWAIPRRSVITKDLIGKGNYKDVFLGDYQGKKVAMMMTTYTEDKNTSQQLLVEAAIMTTLRHPNLVSLIGVCLDEPPLYLITEYMAKGSLLKLLRSQGRAVMSQQDQLDFARDVCKGMVYLEAQKLVHRNLAARNVLIGDDNTAKVSDFRVTREELFMTEQVELLVRWTAPEALRASKFSSKSDVWSFGILLWEIYSYGQKPYPHVPKKEVLEHFAVQGNRMSAPEGCPDGAYQIMKECWDEDASLRPSFTQIESMLERLSISVS